MMILFSKDLLENLMFNIIFKACRPRQWTKNFIVFAGPAFNFDYSGDILQNSIISVISFCLISSSIYLLNDVLDIKSDRKHPIKKFRPIASGKLSIPLALITSFFLAFTSILGSHILIPGYLSYILLSYLILQIIYCLKLKKEPILDIICISSGFLLRASAGIVACKLPNSPWFLITVGMLALFLSIEKRKFELREYLKNGIETRKVLKSYSIPLLLRYENIVTTSCFLTYSLWAAGPNLQGASTSWMMLTIPFVIFGIFRYQLVSDPEFYAKNIKDFENRVTETPEEILFKDSGIQLTLIGWIITISIIGLST